MEISGASGTTASSQASTAQLNSDFDQFLRLLTTQLQNQDPLDPMESSEFTNQLVQFSNVEQQIKSNQLLENLLSAQTLNMTALGVSFIGKNVEVAGEDFEMTDTSSAPISYELPSSAVTGAIRISDENGNTVYSATPELTQGMHSFVWDGLDNNGQRVPAGTYKIVVSGLDKDNIALKIPSYVPGYVNGLETADDGSLVLDIGARKVPLTDVRKISLASQ